MGYKIAFRVMYETPGATGESGGAGAPAAPSPSPTPQPSPAPAAPASGTPPAAAPPAAKTYSYNEDRSNWWNPTKVGELVRREQETNFRLQQLEAMMKAGTGFSLPKPPSAEEQQVAELRTFFLSAIPELKDIIDGFNPQTIGELKELLKQAPGFRSGLSQLYARDGHVVLDHLDEAVAKVYGVDVDKLDPETRSDLTEGFIRWVEADPNRVALSNRRSGGLQLVEQFMRAWSARYVDPFRRAAAAPGAAQARANAGLPAAPKPSGMTPAGTPAPKPKTDEEVHDRAFRSWMAAVGGSR